MLVGFVLKDEIGEIEKGVSDFNPIDNFNDEGTISVYVLYFNKVRRSPHFVCTYLEYTNTSSVL